MLTSLVHCQEVQKSQTFLPSSFFLFRKNAGWSNQIAVEAYVVTIKNAAAPVDKGLLHPLIRRWQARRCSFAVFTLPAVQSVILFKWKAFARRFLFMELILFFIWMVSYYTFCAAMQDEDLSMPLSKLIGTSRGQATVAAEIISLLAMVPFLMLEVGTIGAYGRGWLRDPANILDFFTYGLQIAIATMHLGRIWLASQWLTYCLAVQCVLLMFRLQYFTQVLRPTRFSFASLVRQVVQDTGWVFIFLLLTCVGFGTAFHITFRAEDESPEAFATYIRSVLSCFEHLYGDLELKDFVNSKEPVFATMLALSFIFVMGYCLINLLLGMIINSVDRLMEHEGAKLLCNQAKIINEVEALIPQWFERRHATTWHPTYIHVLRINPKKLDAVEMDRLWTRHGGDGGPVMLSSAGKKDGNGEEDDNEGEGSKNNDKQDEILQKLGEIEKLLELWQQQSSCQRQQEESDRGQIEEGKRSVAK